MPGRKVLVLAVSAGLSFLCAGCLPEGTQLAGTQPEARQVPPEIAGTVGEYATLVGGGSLLLDGHGVVMGLGNKGSSEVPTRLKGYLVEYMLKKKVGSALGGAPAITPSEIIADKDTAVVRMVGVIPPGAPRGWVFDVQVIALTGTGTQSLDGGVLYPYPLYLASGECNPPTSGARAWAEAYGSIFINPFLDPRKRSDAARFREGRLVGGGQVIQSRPLRLILREGDYARCDLIQRRINERFSQAVRIANAKNPSTIELLVPPGYLGDYEHFLQLVLHLPLRAGPGRWEARAREIAEEMTRPAANHDGLALVWEAMGKQVTEVCRSLYASGNPGAAFHAARTGMRLRDEMAGDVLIRLAERSNSPFQVPAIRELGRQEWFLRSIPALRGLVDDPSELVRVAAYEALVILGDTRLIQRIPIGGEFVLDLVTSRRSYVVYATQSHHRRIALFGKDMAVDREAFFNMPNDLLTIAGKDVHVDAAGEVVDPADLRPEERAGVRQTRRLMVFRTIPRTGGISDPFYTDFFVRTLVATLGEPAERDVNGRIKGLGLTYGQVVAALYRICEVDKDVPARFVLQPPPGRERIYEGAGTTGRPDMPGE